MLSTIVQGAGIVIILFVLTQSTLSLVSSFQRVLHQRRHHRLSEELLRERVGAARIVRSQRDEIRFSWSGPRKFEVTRKVEEAKDVCSFILSPHDGKDLPTFAPGQYLTFHLKVPGQSKPVIRCYSLSERSLPDYYRVTIKRLAARNGRPKGLVSNHFHDHIKEGDILDVAAPNGKFTLDLTNQRPVVLLAGGVGFTPLLAMLNAVVATESKREVWMFYGVRNRGDHIMKEHLEAIDREHDNIHLHVCYSQPGPEDVLERDYHHAEIVSVDLLKRVLSSSNYDFYICGPPPMMESLNKDLLAWKVPAANIFSEAFGHASVKRSAVSADGADPTEPSPPPPSPAKISFSSSGKNFEWKPGGGTILEISRNLDISIDVGCETGQCGTCTVAVKSGKVAYAEEPGFGPEVGTCLACVAVPDGDVTIDA